MVARRLALWLVAMVGMGALGHVMQALHERGYHGASFGVTLAAMGGLVWFIVVHFP